MSSSGRIGSGRATLRSGTTWAICGIGGSGGASAPGSGCTAWGSGCTASGSGCTTVGGGSFDFCASCPPGAAIAAGRRTNWQNAMYCSACVFTFGFGSLFSRRNAW